MKKIFKWITLAAASAITCVAFVACGAPASFEEGKTKMQDAGYQVRVNEEDGMKGFTATVPAFEDEAAKTLSAYWFDNVDDAKTYYDTAKAEADESIAEMEEYIATLPDGEEKTYMQEMLDQSKEMQKNIKQSGNWVYAGTKDAIKDFTK